MAAQWEDSSKTQGSLHRPAWHPANAILSGLYGTLKGVVWQATEKLKGETTIWQGGTGFGIKGAWPNLANQVCRQTRQQKYNLSACEQEKNPGFVNGQRGQRTTTYF